MKMWNIRKGSVLRAWMACLGFLGLVLVAQSQLACAPNGKVTIEGLATDCEQDSDCATVLVGDLCQCSCNYAAIKKDQVESYTTTANAARETCGTFGATCGPCAPVDQTKIKCVAKVCTIE